MTVPARSAGDRSTDSPWRTPSISATIRSASAPAGSSRRTTRSAASGNTTTSSAAINAAAPITPAACAACRSETPPTATSGGRSDASSATLSNPTTLRPSKMRSTATEESAGAEADPREAGGGKQAHQLARPERQHVVRHEADGDGVPERGGRQRAAVVGPKEETPAHQTQRIRQCGEDDGCEERGRVGVPEVAHDLGEVYAPERPDQQRHGEHHADERGHGAPPAARRAIRIRQAPAGRGRAAPAAADESIRGRRAGRARPRAAGVRRWRAPGPPGRCNRGRRSRR